MRNTRRVRVAVIGDDDGPLRGVLVALRQSGQFQRDVTDASGRCEFQGIALDAKADLTLAELDGEAWETTARHTLRADLARSTRPGSWSEDAPPADRPAATHTVGRGDCLVRLAYTHGLLPEMLWKHPPNAGLWREHHRKAVLSLGQRLEIPPRRVRWEEATPGAVHVIHRIGVPVIMTIRIVERGGAPCVHTPYVLALKRTSGEDLPHRRGITDQDGCLRTPTPPDVVSGTLVITSSDGAPLWSMALDVGDLRPADEREGANARLINLGYRPRDRPVEALDESGLEAFLGVEPGSAVLDDEAARKLTEAHLF